MNRTSMHDIVLTIVRDLGYHGPVEFIHDELRLAATGYGGERAHRFVSLIADRLKPPKTEVETMPEPVFEWWVHWYAGRPRKFSRKSA